MDIETRLSRIESFLVKNHGYQLVDQPISSSSSTTTTSSSSAAAWDETVESPFVVHFRTSDNQSKLWGNGTRGYNTAYCHIDPGVYTVEGIRVRVLASTRKRVVLEPGVIPQQLGPDTDYILRAGGTYHASNVVVEKNTTVTTDGWQWGKRATVLSGLQVSMAAFIANDRTFFAGFVCDCEGVGADKPDKVGADFFVPEPKCQVTVMAMDILDVNLVVNGNRGPSRVLLDNIRSPRSVGIRSYFSWVQGDGWVIRNCQAQNSTREHIIRCGGADYVQVHDCVFTNEDRRLVVDGADRYDFAKGVIVFQHVSHAYAFRNTCTGPMGCGPLGAMFDLGKGYLEAPPENIPQRSRYIVFDLNRIYGGQIDVHHGVSDVQIINNTIDSVIQNAIPISGYSKEFSRGVERVLIQNNVVNGGYGGDMNLTPVQRREAAATGFVIIGDGAKGIRLVGNTLNSPYLKPGWGEPACVSVGVGVELLESRGNKWPVDAFKIYGSSAMQGGYLRVGEWKRLYPQDQVG